MAFAILGSVDWTCVSFQGPLEGENEGRRGSKPRRQCPQALMKDEVILDVSCIWKVPAVG